MIVLFISNCEIIVQVGTMALQLFNQPIILGCSSGQDEIWNITWPATSANQITAPQKCPGGNETEGKL